MLGAFKTLETILKHEAKLGTKIIIKLFNFFKSFPFP